MAYEWLLSIDENICTWYSLKALSKNKDCPQYNRTDTKSRLFINKESTLVEIKSQKRTYKTKKMIQEHQKLSQVLILRVKI